MEDLLSLTDSELEQVGWLLNNLIKETCTLLGDVAEQASDYLDPDICEDELDVSLRRIVVIVNGLRHILTAHLNGTTNSGKHGLIYRLANL